MRYHFGQLINAAIVCLPLIVPLRSAGYQVVSDKKFHCGTHVIRSDDTNATLRNYPDLFAVGHLYPGEAFYIMRHDAFSQTSPYICNKDQTKCSTARCKSLWDMNQNTPDDIRSECAVQFAWGYADGQDFKGCAWIATGHLTRKGKSRRCDVSAAPPAAKKCLKVKALPYSSIASKGTPRQKHCSNVNSSEIFCGAGRGPERCKGWKLNGCPFKLRSATDAFPNYLGFSNSKVNLVKSAGPDYAGRSKPEMISHLLKDDEVTVRYIARTSTGVPYAMVKVPNIGDRKNTRWAFIPWNDQTIDMATDRDNCIRRGILRSGWKNTCNAASCKKLGSRVCSRNRSSGSPASTDGISGALNEADEEENDLEEPDEGPCVNGECIVGEYCAPDDRCRYFEDDNCIEKPSDKGCVDGEPGCDVCQDAECLPAPNNCIADAALVGPIHPPAQIGSDGAGSGFSPRGSVSIVKAPEGPAELEITVSLTDATRKHKYAIQIWEAGEVGEPVLAETGTTLTTDAKGSGTADILLPLPWQVYGGAALGDGVGSESPVVVLDDRVDPRSTGERFATAAPVSMNGPTCPTGTGPCQQVAEWNTTTAGESQSFPTGIVLDSSANVYVSDFAFHHIRKFDPAGTLLSQWGELGASSGNFSSPLGLAVDAANDLLVVDFGNSRIQKFTPAGVLVALWGSNGPYDGQFSLPTGVAVSGDGATYVADRGNHRMQKFDSSGVFLTKWGAGTANGQAGQGNGEFAYPSAAVVSQGGKVYVSEEGNNRIQRFDANGAFELKWGRSGGDGSSGVAPGEFTTPHGIAIDGSGDIYVVDTDNHRIQKFDPSGVFLAACGRHGTGPGEFYAPWGIALDSSGQLYVTDQGNSRVQTLAPLHSRSEASQE